MDRMQGQASNLERLAFLDCHVGAGQAVKGRSGDPAAGSPLQFERTGDMVGMDMGVEGGGERQAEVPEFG
jgi:hypothetical protein